MQDVKSSHLDPISGAPGAHPVGVGVGAVVGGAAAGAATGAVGGPVGAAVGGVIGAIAGGLGGKAIAESINPTAEEAYWRDSYESESYYEVGRSYDDYAPAYRLGLEGRTRYEGDFDDIENHLAAEWVIKKERSTLTWPQARAASRAAWERVDQRIRQNTGGVASGSAAYNSIVPDNDDVIDTLNDLLETCRDGEYGFNASAEHTQSLELKTMLLRHAGECRTAGLELESLIRQLGGEPAEGGSVSGALHRGWVSVRSILSAYSDQALLSECERGEDAAAASYRKALKENLPSGIRSVVERQEQGVLRNHDQVKAMRDALKSAE